MDQDIQSRRERRRDAFGGLKRCAVAARNDREWRARSLTPTECHALSLALSSACLHDQTNSIPTLFYVPRVAVTGLFDARDQAVVRHYCLDALGRGVIPAKEAEYRSRGRNGKRLLDCAQRTPEAAQALFLGGAADGGRRTQVGCGHTDSGERAAIIEG